MQFWQKTQPILNNKKITKIEIDKKEIEYNINLLKTEQQNLLDNISNIKNELNNYELIKNDLLFVVWELNINTKLLQEAKTELETIKEKINIKNDLNIEISSDNENLVNINKKLLLEKSEKESELNKLIERVSSCEKDVEKKRKEFAKLNLALDEKNRINWFLTDWEIIC